MRQTPSNRRGRWATLVLLVIVTVPLAGCGAITPPRNHYSRDLAMRRIHEMADRIGKVIGRPVNLDRQYQWREDDCSSAEISTGTSMSVSAEIIPITAAEATSPNPPILRKLKAYWDAQPNTATAAAGGLDVTWSPDDALGITHVEDQTTLRADLSVVAPIKQVPTYTLSVDIGGPCFR
jgi:hypothetical protein